MKLQALYDSNGVILAAAQIGEGYDGPVPVAAEGAEMAHLDVPEAMAGSTLDEICRTMRVDPERCILVSKAG